MGLAGGAIGRFRPLRRGETGYSLAVAGFAASLAGLLGIGCRRRSGRDRISPSAPGAAVLGGGGVIVVARPLGVVRSMAAVAGSGAYAMGHAGHGQPDGDQRSTSACASEVIILGLRWTGDCRPIDGALVDATGRYGWCGGVGPGGVVGYGVRGIRSIGAQRYAVGEPHRRECSNPWAVTALGVWWLGRRIDSASQIQDPLEQEMSRARPRAWPGADELQVEVGSSGCHSAISMKCGIASFVREWRARRADIASLSVVTPGGLHSDAELVDHIGVPVQHKGVVGDGHDLDREVIPARRPSVSKRCVKIGSVRNDAAVSIAASRSPGRGRVGCAKPRRGSSGSTRPVVGQVVGHAVDHVRREGVPAAARGVGRTPVEVPCSRTSVPASALERHEIVGGEAPGRGSPSGFGEVGGHPIPGLP